MTKSNELLNNPASLREITTKPKELPNLKRTTPPSENERPVPNDKKTDTKQDKTQAIKTQPKKKGFFGKLFGVLAKGYEHLENALKVIGSTTCKILSYTPPGLAYSFVTEKTGLKKAWEGSKTQNAWKNLTGSPLSTTLNLAMVGTGLGAPMGIAGLFTTAVFNRGVYSTVLFGASKASGSKDLLAVADVVNYPGLAVGNLIEKQRLDKGIISHEAFWIDKNKELQLARIKSDKKKVI